MLRPVILTTFALLAIGSTGCLFSGRPCEPGDWHYHSYGCRHTAGSGECQTRETPPPSESFGLPDRPMIQPTPEKIPPLPTTGATGRYGLSRTRTQRVAQLQEKEPYRPRMPTQADSESNLTENTVAAGVQKCNWQQPDDVPSRSEPTVDAPEGTPRRGHVTRGFGSGSAENSESHAIPPANATPPSSIPQPVPYAWGFFGASGRW